MLFWFAPSPLAPSFPVLPRRYQIRHLRRSRARVNNTMYATSFSPPRGRQRHTGRLPQAVYTVPLASPAKKSRYVAAVDSRSLATPDIAAARRLYTAVRPPPTLLLPTQHHHPIPQRNATLPCSARNRTITQPAIIRPTPSVVVRNLNPALLFFYRSHISDLRGLRGLRDAIHLRLCENKRTLRKDASAAGTRTVAAVRSG